MTTIDRIDRRILMELQYDGRITNAELAQRVGLAPTSMSDRMRRLQKQGYIKGFKAVLDPEQMGLGLLVFIEVSLDKTTPDNFQKFANAVRKQPEVLECHMVAGGFDYLVKARLHDMARYRVFLSDVLLSLPGVKESHTYPVIEEVKDDGILPI
ncbi:Lrp/AsnC ligand binding domain-containing protein [Pelagibacterium halotolerans]|uniref:PutR, transcriptional activator of PutA and PutP n=1 Tax=Pelagibacterium halotolerans (strain DSM 22347 / JCM 15775 / CGMCC 1.7692 / B2) TaxID=1082931 RepID=G4R740_PELHB|nr:Lrp/AsnC ligand binding domain-containing protein [Pelagibacterium halotolerans]AEQ50194.1 PutR, transcriptional activator of PutA and PutP [Pelagibacterium halotolerans B2]QJR19802.1 winged helix-turn-helix transcriptional regulator [Pelagibacterium halotolerans]SEA50299.1 transcriptional regulator, AsnC family [Pelagibacterium halotolerans]